MSTASVILRFCEIFNANVDSQRYVDLIASEANVTKEKATEQIVEYLLENYSTIYGDVFCTRCPDLKSAYQTKCSFYQRVLEAYEKDPTSVADIPEVSQDFNNRSWCECAMKLHIAQEHVRKAQMASDVVISFPGHMRFKLITPAILDEPAATRMAERLMDAIDQGGRWGSEMKYVRFFLKQTALIETRKKQTRKKTFADLVAEWACTNEDAKAKVKQFWHLLPEHANPTEIQPLISKVGMQFSSFVIEKTIDEFEQVLGIKLSDEMRKTFAQDLEEEAARMEVVYYTGHFQELIDDGPKLPNKSQDWLVAAQKLAFLEEECTLSSENCSRLFEWIYHTPSQKVLRQSSFARCDGNTAIEQMFRLEAILGEGQFKEDALEIFNLVKYWDPHFLVSQMGLYLDQHYEFRGEDGMSRRELFLRLRKAK